MTNMKTYMGYLLTPRSKTLDDLELAVGSNFLGTWRHFSCFGGNNS